MVMSTRVGQDKSEGESLELQINGRIEPKTARNDGVEKNTTTEDSCIMVVGTSGTGKTTLLNIFTGAQEKTGGGAQAVTNNTVHIRDTLHSNYPSWLDNPGWSDPDGKADSYIFKNLLREMQRLGLSKLAAVIWCVLPQPRMDTTLQGQAKFIDEFTVDIEAGKIWSNVIVVAKGKSASVEEDCQGAKKAACKLWVHADPICLGWSLISDQDVKDFKDDRTRKEIHRNYTKDEIRHELEKAISLLPPPVQVVFSNQLCRSCGQKGDPRLMEDKCHRNKKKGHHGTLQQRFSKKEVGLAMAGGAVGISALVGVSIATGAAEAMAALPLFAAPFSCLAGHRVINTRKDSPSPCGPVRLDDMRWSCCGAREVGEEGCTEFCDKCDVPWGQGPPCTLIRSPDANLQVSEGDFEVKFKKHDLVEIVEELASTAA